MSDWSPRTTDVVLDVPARSRSLRLLRLAAADAASGLGMDIDAVESARIAIDELGALLLSTGCGSRLVVTLRSADGCLEVRGELRGAGAGAVAPRQDSVVRDLLGVCVDAYELLDDPAFCFSITSGVVGPGSATLGRG